MITEKIRFNNRTFYAKYERINEPFTELVLRQHFNKEYTIALPLIHRDHTNYLVLEYKGEEYKRFIAVCKHLFATIEIKKYTICQGNHLEKIQIFIDVAPSTLHNADIQLSKISFALEKRMSKKWKCFPSLNLPLQYNIITIPYFRLQD